MDSKIRRLTLNTMTACMLLAGVAGFGPLGADKSGWKDEFERICGQTHTAGTLDAKALEELVDASNILIEELRGSAEPAAKIYVFRLEKCRDFFEYSRELLKEPE